MNRFVKYVEPFVGGGAVFFHVAGEIWKNCQFEEEITQFYINDINEELILAYKTIKEDVVSVIELLRDMESKFLSKDPEKRKAQFYEVRRNFNEKRIGINFAKFSDEWIERTAEIIFLNRTCFNGLFRVNKQGNFNVPIGSYKNPKILNESNLIAVSNLLNHTEIEKGDFTKFGELIDERTFVYFDPPYRPLTQSSSFTSYSRYSFDDSEQRRLAEYFKKLDQKGAKLMLSNSDPKNEDPEDSFFDDLYSEFNIERVPAKRMINSKADGRGEISELVITNY